MTREDLTALMQETEREAKEERELMERETIDPEFHAKRERERQLAREEEERRENAPLRAAVRKSTISRLKDYYWHVARRRDNSEFIHRMDALGKQGHGGSIDDAINFLLDEMEIFSGYSQW